MKTALRALALSLALLLGLQAPTTRAEVVFVPELGGGGSADTSLSTLTLLATYTPSGAASVDITSVISASFDQYEIRYELIPATDDVELWARTDDANGASFDSGATNYRYNELASTTALATQDTEIVIAGAAAASASAGNGANEGCTGTLSIHRLGSGTTWPVVTGHAACVSADGVVRNMMVSGVRENAAAINAVQLLFESGNIASGKVRVYGVPKTAGSGALASYAPSAAASVDITSVITSACYKHRIDFDLLPATDDVELRIRTDDANGASFDTGASDYTFAQSGVRDSTASVFSYVSTGATALAIGEDTAALSVGNAASEGVSGSITIERVGSGTLQPYLRWDVAYLTAEATATAARLSGSGRRAAAAAINAVQLLFESGNIASGTVKVYCVPS